MNTNTLKKISNSTSEDIKIIAEENELYASQILECDRVIKDAKIHKDFVWIN